MCRKCILTVALTALFVFRAITALAQCIYISGDINGDGDATPLADIMYGAGYFRGGPPPGISCECQPNWPAGDVNGTCMFNGIDLTYLAQYWIGEMDSLLYCANCAAPQPDSMLPLTGIDPDLPDSIIMGNLDGTPVISFPGDTVSIPIWVKNDESVAGICVSMATDSAYFTDWIDGSGTFPLEVWNLRFASPEFSRPAPGYGSQTLLGLNNNGHTNVCLNTEGIYQQVASFRMVVSSNDEIIGDTIQLIPSSHSRAGLSAFCDSAGLAEWPVTVAGGRVAFVNYTTHIGLSRDEFVDTLLWGYSVTADLIISNLGTNDLLFQLQDSSDWIGESITSGRLSPSQSDTVIFTFDAASLTPGTYFGNIDIVSNDSVTSLISLPVTLVVQAGSPFGRIEGTVLSPWSLPLGGVTVTLNPTGLADTTEVNGTYSLGPVPAQIYSISFSNASYSDTSIDGVELSPYDTIVADMRLTGVLYPQCIQVPGQYATIQAGISHSTPNDTVLVGPGRYRENIGTGQQINLISSGGPEATIIYGGTGGTYAIDISSDLPSLIQGFTIEQNTELPMRVGYGSAIIKGNIFRNNTDHYSGGAIYVHESQYLELVDNTFIGNSTVPGHSGVGGAVTFNYVIRLFAHGNTFIGNTSITDGGAVYAVNCDTTSIHHNLFYNNHCAQDGAAILFINCNSDNEFYNNTIVGNSSDQPDVSGAVSLVNSDSMKIYNNIIVLNTGVGLYYPGGYNFVAPYNDVWGNITDYFGVIPGDGYISENPQFVGGDPYSFELLAGSPCIDAGDPDSPLDPDSTRADMGAFYFRVPAQIGYISGVVTDSLLTPLSNVRITVLSTPLADTTDAAGSYLLGWLAEGSYDLHFVKGGFRDTTILGVTVSVFDTTELDVVMEVSSGGCNYITGDINGSGVTNGLDVTYGVAFFKGGPRPPIACDMCPEPAPFYAGGDVNGSCSFNGLDVTYMVAYFKGGPLLQSCPDCPPTGR